MKAKFKKRLFRNVSVVFAVVIAITLSCAEVASSGDVPDVNICSEAGFEDAGAEALCNTYIYHLRCFSPDPRATVRACDAVLSAFNAKSDIPMPLANAAELWAALYKAASVLQCRIDNGEPIPLKQWIIHEDQWVNIIFVEGQVATIQIVLHSPYVEPLLWRITYTSTSGTCHEPNEMDAGNLTEEEWQFIWSDVVTLVEDLFTPYSQ